MKTLKEQIQNRCIHFTGIFTNATCKAGVNYADVRTDDRPIKLPCLKQGGECLKSQFPTEEQAKAEAEEIEKNGDNAVIAYIQIKAHYKNTKQLAGKIVCECGGELRYSIAESNEHIWAACSTCGINIRE